MDNMENHTANGLKFTIKLSGTKTPTYTICLQQSSATSTGYDIQTRVRSWLFLCLLRCREPLHVVYAATSAAEIVYISRYSFTEWMHSFRNSPANELMNDVLKRDIPRNINHQHTIIKTTKRQDSIYWKY